MNKPPEYVHEICSKCGDKHCCRGVCKEMNDYLVKKENKGNK